MTISVNEHVEHITVLLVLDAKCQIQLYFSKMTTKCKQDHTPSQIGRAKAKGLKLQNEECPPLATCTGM